MTQHALNAQAVAQRGGGLRHFRLPFLQLAQRGGNGGGGQILRFQHQRRAGLLQRGGNGALVVGQHQQQRRQAETAALPRRAARRADGQIGLRHQLRHIVGGREHAAGVGRGSGKFAHGGGVRRGGAHHYREREFQAAGQRLQRFEHRERVVVFVHAAQIEQDAAFRLL